MSKTVTIIFTEKEYEDLILCYSIGNLVKDSVEIKSKTEIFSNMEFSQKLSKAAYDSKFKGAKYHRDGDIYEYGNERRMLDIFEKFQENDVNFNSFQEEESLEQIRENLKQMGLIKN